MHLVIHRRYGHVTRVTHMGVMYQGISVVPGVLRYFSVFIYERMGMGKGVGNFYRVL